MSNQGPQWTPGVELENPEMEGMHNEQMLANLHAAIEKAYKNDFPIKARGLIEEISVIINKKGVAALEDARIAEINVALERDYGFKAEVHVTYPRINFGPRNNPYVSLTLVDGKPDVCHKVKVVNEAKFAATNQLAQEQARGVGAAAAAASHQELKEDGSRRQHRRRS